MERVRRVNRHPLTVTHAEKVLFPNDGITKGELLAYYEAVAPTMLPYLTDRLLTLHRFPEGIDHPGFYQREIGEGFPRWIRRRTVRDKAGGTTTSVLCNTVATLLYLVNQDVITFHPWLSRADRVTVPDRLLFDLDPSTTDFTPVRTTARVVHDVLGEIGLLPFVQTTGSRGLYVVVPLQRRESFDTVRTFAREIAHAVMRRDPHCCTVELRKKKRDSRVYIDTLRNSYAQSAVAPYSVRAKSSAPVAAPLTWEELDDPLLHPQRYTIRTIPERLKKMGDPWGNIQQSARALSPARRRLAPALSP